MLIENLTTGLPQSPVLRDVFTLQRAGYRAESGDKKGAREDVERAMKGLRETLPDTSATFIQYFQGAAKTYIRLGDKKPAAAALQEIEALISKAGAQLGAMAPVLIADLKLLEGRYLLLKRKKKKAIAEASSGAAPGKVSGSRSSQSPPPAIVGSSSWTSIQAPQAAQPSASRSGLAPSPT